MNIVLNKLGKRCYLFGTLNFIDASFTHTIKIVKEKKNIPLFLFSSFRSLRFLMWRKNRKNIIIQSKTMIIINVCVDAYARKWRLKPFHLHNNNNTYSSLVYGITRLPPFFSPFTETVSRAHTPLQQDEIDTDSPAANQG